jgi:N-acetylglucosaminyldiphosphoundecaprenol N-acetyl-beta-D-mannosaminyltransferase
MEISPTLEQPVRKRPRPPQLPVATVRRLRKPFDFVLFRGTLDQLATRPPGRGSGRLIVTPNTDHLRLLTRSRTFRRAYAAADVVLNDSRALDRTFIGGTAFCLTGTDLTPEMLKRLAPGAVVFSVGCTPEVEAAMCAAYPALDLRFLNPSMGYIRKRAERRAIVAAILAADPACVFVSTGAPQSEIMAAQLKRAGCDADILCCGSGLLFLAGSTPRAPVWLQNLGGEWFWRFLLEPRTRKRYARDALFLLANLPALLELRRTGVARFTGFRLLARGRSLRGR